LAFAFALQKAQTSKRADTLYQNIKAFNTTYLTKRKRFWQNARVPDINVEEERSVLLHGT